MTSFDTAGAYKVEIAWAQQLLGGFTLDTSTLDGTAVLGATFGYSTYDDVTAVTKSVSITRGRPSDMSTMNQGMCTLKLVDPSGTYNPQNPNSPLFGNLLPMRPLRVSYLFEGTPQYLFFGYVTRIEMNPVASVQEVTIEAGDFFEWLNSALPIIATQTNQTVDQLITTIVKDVGFVEPSMINMEGTGDLIASWTDADGTKNCLTLIQNLLATDLGMFFISGAGAPTYITRTMLHAPTAPVATLDGTEITAILGSVDVHGLINHQVVTRTGGTAQTADDQTSQNMYGRRDGSPLTSPNLSSDAVALSLAQYLVSVQKDPRPPARNVTLRSTPGTNAFVQQLQRELGDYVTVTEPRGSTNITGYIESINHTITDGGLVHTTVYTVQAPAITNVFTLDVSTLDSAAVLSY